MLQCSSSLVSQIVSKVDGALVCWIVDKAELSNQQYINQQYKVCRKVS